MSVEIEILRPLQKIEVITSRVGGPRVGSIGYVGYVNPTLTGSNMLVDICFSRSGKTGKPRIQYTTTKYFPVTCVDVATKLGLNDVTLLKGIDHDSMDVRNFASYDFLCYLYAFTNFIMLLSDTNKAGGYHMGRSMGRIPIIELSDNVGSMSIIDLYAFIYSCEAQFKAIDAHILIDKVANYFDNTDNRSVFMDKAHKLLSAFNNTLKEYRLQLKTTYASYEKRLTGIIDNNKQLNKNGLV